MAVSIDTPTKPGAAVTLDRLKEAIFIALWNMSSCNIHNQGIVVTGDLIEDD